MSEHNYALPALKRLRAGLAGEIERLHAEAEKAARQMEHVDAVLLMLDPSLELAAIKPRSYTPRSVGERKAGSRMVIDIMREAGRPLRVCDLVELVIARKGLTDLDGPSRFKLNHSVENCMHRLRAKGQARAIPQELGPQAWVLAS